ncbi:hypothetical protein [Aquimarina macrocephali]|uniref:hypothetical protein n=1 Tax=Aquimarina macrocephali TaxID=666563 RepID=UPI00046637AC|nr:hypothetical protein [Aquimarina macrocephali]
MLYKFNNRDKINFDADNVELNSEANTLTISIFRQEDYENHNTRNSIDIQLNEEDLEDMILALTNIQREIFEYKKSK